jgi:Trichohyalin-plectin-homology domain
VQERMKREMMAANQRQMEAKRARAAEAATKADAERATMLAKFAADDRLEQLNAQKRRMKQIEHKREARRRRPCACCQDCLFATIRMLGEHVLCANAVHHTEAASTKDVFKLSGNLMSASRAQVDRLLDEKRTMFEATAAERAASEAAARARDDRELDLVERERRRLLRDAADLLDFLPKGVLRSKADLDYVLALTQELKTKGRLE